VCGVLKKLGKLWVEHVVLAGCSRDAEKVCTPGMTALCPKPPLVNVGFAVPNPGIPSHQDALELSDC
jgi:hypothetical protein